MRTTLAPSMLNALALNMNRGNAEVKLMELAPVFIKAEGAGELPGEHPSLVIGMYGENVDFFALKRVVMCLCQRYGLVPDVEAGGDGYYHPGRKATRPCAAAA